ncbi:hypothetical protein MAR_022293, partial [Mya arenaria]
MAYFAKCLEVSWLAAVQDPPLALNFCPGEKFDTALFKDYNKRVGPYVEFLVWPALHLYANGPLLTKGVAQGCQQNPYNRRRFIPSDQSFTFRFEQQRSISRTSSEPRDTDAIPELSDPKRPSKVAEKLKELYEIEWKNALDSLDQSIPETENIKSLLDVLNDIFHRCKALARNTLMKDVPTAEYLTIEMIPQEQLSSQSRQVKAYFEKCVEVCWLAAVQDPPLELNFSPGEKFDTALFKDYTERGPYVEFQ